MIIGVVHFWHAELEIKSVTYLLRVLFVTLDIVKVGVLI